VLVQVPVPLTTMQLPELSVKLIVKSERAGADAKVSPMPKNRQYQHRKRDPFHDRHPSQQTTTATTLTPHRCGYGGNPSQFCET
jgi:hypothetical protein